MGKSSVYASKVTATFDRTDVVDHNFTSRVKAGDFPAACSSTTFQDANLSRETVLSIFDAMIKSRHLDLIARHLKSENKAFYTISSAGHEANAAVAAAFNFNDMAFLHYRSCAFMLQRAQSTANSDIVKNTLRSLMALKTDPIASGRHKVFGSKVLFVPPQTSTIASHLPKAVGMAASIKRAQLLKTASVVTQDSVVICSFGDASINHSTAQGAINSARWLAYQHYPLPLVFVCEDNNWGISVRTPPDWVENLMAHTAGICYIKADGLNVADTYRSACQAATIARIKRQPVFLHLKLVRLLGHAGTDFELQYRTLSEIESDEQQDPLLHMARQLIDSGFLSKDAIIDAYQKTRSEIANLANVLLEEPQLGNATEVMASIVPCYAPINLPILPSDAVRKKAFEAKYKKLSQLATLGQQINFVLTDLMLQYNNILVFGEDVAKKGGVYRITADLFKTFEAARVFDTILDEQSILGYAIGHAQNGFIPIPEIQFLAYLHNAEDQLRGEAATLSFFSNGQFSNPMIIRIAGYAYQKGFGGHFHNDNSIAVLRDIPGIIIASPSNGVDAVGMLRQCVEMAYQQGRVVVFIEPIALYGTKDLYEKGDVAWMAKYPGPAYRINLGEVGVYGQSSEVAIITYANGVYLSLQASRTLAEQYSINAKIIDLRWLAPLPEQALLDALGDIKNVLIVDECRQTGSISEQIITFLYLTGKLRLNIQRVSALDCFIPLGPPADYLLPSRAQIVDGVLLLLAVKAS